MKNKLTYLPLIILPVILFILALYIRDLRGDYYLYSGYDGVYGYLLSSLNIAQLKSPGFAQHPGIVTQLIIATVIKLSHLFWGKDTNIVLDTFNRPEFYLAQINFTFIYLTIFALFILGIVSYKKTGNIFAAFFIQLTPFISILIIFLLTQNAVEGTTMIFMLLLLSISISYMFEKIMTKKKNIIYIISFGIICGLSLATKISILPILIIPFLLIKKFSAKGLFILISVSVFSILFFSLCPETSRFLSFLFRSISKSGWYGTGSEDIIDTTQIIPTFNLIINQFLLFFIIFIIMIITLLLQFIPKFKNKIRANKFSIVLTGIVIIQSAYIMLLFKMPIDFYLMPALMFSVFGLYAVNSILIDLFPRIFVRSKYLYLYIFFLVITIVNYNSLKIFVRQNILRKNESYKVIKYLDDNYKHAVVISTDFTSSMPTAFYEGLYYSGSQLKYYHSILKNKYPKYIYFELWAKKFKYIADNSDLIDELIKSDTIVYHSLNESNFIDFKEKLIESTNRPNTTFSEVFSNKLGEKIYLVNLKE
ncbi:MAG: hypothetical protein WBQ38_09990 [Ignavibacteria bacterium]